MYRPAHALHGHRLTHALARPFVGSSRRAGVSIIETLVAVVVIGIVIVPIFNSLVSGRMMTAHRGEKRMALRLVERKTEQLMTAGYGSSGSDADVGSVNLDAGTHPSDPSIVVNTRGDDDAGNDVLGDLTWLVVPMAWSSPGDSVYVKSVEVMLRWPSAAPRDSLILTTLIGQ
jgi:type II secretory pathway pseudopilin PulG